jgi:hypothetical protein
MLELSGCRQEGIVDPEGISSFANGGEAERVAENVFETCLEEDSL